MPTCKSLRPIALALILSALAAGTTRAGVLIFKDGFVLQGTVKKDKDVIIAHGQNGPRVFEFGKRIFLFDDHARLIGFAEKQVAEVSAGDAAQDYKAIKNGGRIGHRFDPAMPPLLHVESATPWNDKWDRDVTVRTAEGGKITFRERLTELTPYYARVEAWRYRWGACYLTTEFRPEEVRRLLAHRPGLTAAERNDKVAQRFLLYRFFARAGWYDEAAKELAGIAKDFPAEKEKVVSSRKDLQTLQTLELYHRLQRAYKAGQHGRVQEQLARFPAVADAKALAGVQSLRSKYGAANEELKLAQTLLKVLPDKLAAGDRLREAAATIRKELTPDDFLPDSSSDKLKSQRLEPFLSMAQQAERDRTRGRRPAHSPAQLLSLAGSGWLQGKESAEAKPATARRLWRARNFVLTYQKTADQEVREHMLAQSEKPDKLGIDEVAQLIGMLPPPCPEPYTGTDATELRTRGKGLPYLLQLPPEYHVGRPYPVLFALHQAGEKPSDILDRLAGWAGKYGYMLVAPRWAKVRRQPYGYTPAEQTAVTDVLLDLRQRFQVDSDRVFLLGFGEGAAMAYDVGLSHPDLFAGVVPISGAPAKFALRYYRNAQRLPFYVVDGSHAGAVATQSAKQFDNHWVHGYPALHITYKGRGVEWFAGELPSIFSWMDGKKRARGLPPPGEYVELQTMRPTDNHCYWLSTDSINERRLNDAASWDPRTSPATMRVRIGTGNQVILDTDGLKQVTLWLGRDMTIDFDKPLRILLNRTRQLNVRVQPSLATLLEDFYARGDRQRLFFAKVAIDRP